MQFAKTFGAEVTAFSTSKDKEAEAKTLGAHNFVNTRDTGALKKVAGSFDFLLVDGKRGSGLAGVCECAAAQGNAVPGRCATFADTDQGSSLLRSQKAVAGSPIGSPHDLGEMLDVAARHGVKAITERFAMAKANDAVTKVKKNRSGIGLCWLTK